MQAIKSSSPGQIEEALLSAMRIIEPHEATEETAVQSNSLQTEYVRCCICDTDDALPVGVGCDFEYRTSAEEFLAMRCASCGLVYLNPRPTLDEMSRIYPENYHAFNFSEEKFGMVYKVRRKLEWRRARTWTRGLPEDARILDVGCGDGFHLDLLREYGTAGWQLEGVDANERAVEAATQRGHRVHLATIEELSLPASSYDLALLIATIEHVSDPPGVLRAVHSLLKPGGRAVIVTDNTGSPDFRFFHGRHWGGYHFPRHFNLFNADALRRLAAKTGFEVERLDPIVSPVNWVYSVRNLLDDLNAPRALVKRFSLQSPVTLAAGTILDKLCQLATGRGALLSASLRRTSLNGESL